MIGYGIIYHLFAQLLYAFSSILGKLLFNRGLGVGQLLFYSCSIQILSSCYFAWQRTDRKRMKSLCLLGFLGGFAKAAKFVALYFADPGNVTVFINLVVLLVRTSFFFSRKRSFDSTINRVNFSKPTNVSSMIFLKLTLMLLMFEMTSDV